MPEALANQGVCMVAILKDETPFLAEWICYHRLLGVDHFVLYDNDWNLPLKDYLAPLRDWVTVVDWPGDHAKKPGSACQTSAYMHALMRIRGAYRWVAYLDGDEFIVLRKHRTLPEFLLSFREAAAVYLNWYQFGHNGYFNDPSGLLTSALTRRHRTASSQFKAITRVDAIQSIWTPHFCVLQDGLAPVDANGRAFSPEVYPEKTGVAHVNHYRCRSFSRWMARAKRGDAMGRKHLNPPDLWRLDEAGLLRQFVEVVAKEDNELVDEYMLGYADAIRAKMKELGFREPPAAGVLEAHSS
jgi:hypothetical protein